MGRTGHGLGRRLSDSRLNCMTPVTTSITRRMLHDSPENGHTITSLSQPFCPKTSINQKRSSRIIRAAAVHKLERQNSKASRMSEGRGYRLSLPNGRVSGALRGGSGDSRRLTANNVAHLGYAFAAPPLDRTNSEIHDRGRSLCGFVHRDARWEHFEWWIETTSQRMRKPRALAPPTGRQEVSDEFPRPGRC